jgi:hypothetical protein
MLITYCPEVKAFQVTLRNYLGNYGFRKEMKTRHQWLTPGILGSWEAEIRGIMVRGK